MNKKYQIKLVGYLYEVTKEKHKEMKREGNHTYYLKVQKKESGIVVHSLDALKEREFSGIEVIADKDADVEANAIKNMLIKAMNAAKEKLEPDERLLLELLYEENMTEEEAGNVFGITQQAISKRHSKIIQKLRKIMKL